LFLEFKKKAISSKWLFFHPLAAPRAPKKWPADFFKKAISSKWLFFQPLAFRPPGARRPPRRQPRDFQKEIKK